MGFDLKSKKNTVDISVIIPVYNEQETLDELFRRLNPVCKGFNKSYEIIFINDGSKDLSARILNRLHDGNRDVVKVLTFSRNYGHQLAITAGLDYCRGKAAVIVDADLQDPPGLIPEFIKKWEEGYEIVYGVRKERKGETFLKKATAAAFYKLIRFMSSIDIPENAGDFYLLDRKVIDILSSLRERHRFLRGLVAWVGYKRAGIEYVREPRHSGKTKYSYMKMLKFSFDAITSFSFAPLRIVSFLGAVFSVISFFSISVIIYIRLFTNSTVTGWSSIMAVVLFIGGIQLLAMGVIGEYIARIGDDVKSRPLYTISQCQDQ